ncbi:MAG TPA: hypothetical protein VF864_07400 [Gemmatimonadales bacterium]
MTIDPSWVTAFAIIALPVLGFILGARWMNYRQLLGRSQGEVQARPMATDTLDVLDSVQAQVEELAERQDFAERLLLQRKETEPQRSHEATTPV